jgi:hypothetical protein
MPANGEIDKTIELTAAGGEVLKKGDDVNIVDERAVDGVKWDSALIDD